MRLHSLKSKLLIIVSLLVIGSGLLISLLVTHRYSQSLFESMTAQAENLAQAIAPECEIEYVGIRPGEKLHEALITEEEGRNAISYNGMYIVLPNYSWWKRIIMTK